MNDAKTVVRVVLLFTALLGTTGIAGDDVPDLSQLGSRSELDTLIASSGDAALKKALVDHADDILAAAEPTAIEADVVIYGGRVVKKLDRS